MKLLIIFISLLTFKTYAKDLSFQLKDRECKMIGAAVGEQTIKTPPAVSNTNTCSLSVDTLSCKREGSEQAYKVEMKLGEIVIAKSASGNVTYVLNLKEKSYVTGQTNLLLDKGVVLNKSCVGKLINK